MCITTISTFFGVTDIGMATMLGTNAFDMLIIRGVFFLLGGIHTNVDWYKSSRDTLFLVIVLGAVAGLMISPIEVWNTILMLGLYLVYVIFIKFNSKIEPRIKKFVELRQKFKLPPRLDVIDIKRKHCISKDLLKRYSPEVLMEEAKNFTSDSKFITLNFTEPISVCKIPYKFIPKSAKCSKIVERINYVMMAIFVNKRRIRNDHILQCISHEKALLMQHKAPIVSFEAAASIIDKKKGNGDEAPNKQSSSKVSRQISKAISSESKPDEPKKEEETDRGKDYKDESKSLKSDKEDNKSQKDDKENKGSVGETPSKDQKSERSEGNLVRRTSEGKKKADSKSDKEEDEEDVDSSDEGEGKQKQEPMSLRMPKTGGKFKKFMYFLTLPFNALTYYTIPDPLIPKRYNLLPLTFMSSYAWMMILSFFITWWMAIVTDAFDIDYQFIPFFVVPLGLVIRDIDKFQDIRDQIKMLAETNNLLTIPEPYSTSIFQFSVATAVNWLIFTIAVDKISFKNNYIYTQVLLLLAIVLIRFITIIALKFKGKRRIFVIYLIVYLVYVAGFTVIQLMP